MEEQAVLVDLGQDLETKEVDLFAEERLEYLFLIKGTKIFWGEVSNMKSDNN